MRKKNLNENLFYYLIWKYIFRRSIKSQTFNLPPPSHPPTYTHTPFPHPPTHPWPPATHTHTLPPPQDPSSTSHPHPSSTTTTPTTHPHPNLSSTPHPWPWAIHTHTFLHHPNPHPLHPPPLPATHSSTPFLHPHPSSTITPPPQRTHPQPPTHTHTSATGASGRRPASPNRHPPRKENPLKETTYSAWTLVPKRSDVVLFAQVARKQEKLPVESREYQPREVIFTLCRSSLPLTMACFCPEKTNKQKTTLI